MKIDTIQLSGYSALAAGIIGLSNADAQILYSDIEPDTLLQFDGDNYYLDMDMDGAADFHFVKISFTGYSEEYGDATYHKDVFVAGIDNDKLFCSQWTYGFCESCSTSFTTPYALDASFSVNNALEFFTGGQMASRFDDYPWGGGAGNWGPDTEDKFLGAKFDAGDGELHFGWIRCSVVDDYVLIIKDYACNMNAEEAIITGEIMHNPVWVDATDIGDNMNGSDLLFSFQKSTDESHINEYRIIAVKEALAVDFSVTDAEFIPPENYKSIIPDGSEIYTSDLTGIFDSDGEPITNNISYRLFIYSIVDADYSAVSIMSSASDPIILQTETTPATSVSINDIADNVNSSDIHLQFAKAINEDVILHYRIFILDVVTIFDGFTIDDAMSVSPDNYFELEPAGSDIDMVLPAGLTDINGIPITWGTPYYLFVASIDNGLGTGSQLSEPSNELILNMPVSIDDNLNPTPLVYFQNNILHVEVPHDLNYATKIYLSDNLGRIVFESDLDQTSNYFELHIPDGVYIATLYSGDFKQSQKINIQN